jgi:phosphoglycolate phosphatase-like HAD superfamily hydrolase
MDSASRRLIEHAPLVIVDFDGTLVNLATGWGDLKRQLAAICEAREWSWETGGRLDTNLRRVRTESGESAFTELCAVVTEAEVSGFSPFAVAQELILTLSSRHPDPVAIVTNNTRPAVQRILRDPVFRGFKPRVIGKGDVYESKPSPQGLVQACRLFVAPTRATVFIGDSDVDELASAAAGIGIFLRVSPPGRSRMRLAA